MSGLDRRLGPLDGAAVVVSNVIGSGIFLLPAVVAGLTPHPWWMIGAWVAGGALAFAGAMAYAELAALRPRAGGEYVYLREAFGPLPAFLTGSCPPPATPSRGRFCPSASSTSASRPRPSWPSP